MIVTPIYAGILAILFFVLSIRVVALRKHGASLGDGGDERLQRRIRVTATLPSTCRSSSS
jgi:uncharacterized membrane protein YecN with MAPEG domain